MSEILKKENIQKKGSIGVEKKDLSSLSRDLKQQLENLKAGKTMRTSAADPALLSDVLLLLDVSGSMNERTKDFSTKLDNLKDAISDPSYQNCKKVAFTDHAYEVSNQGVANLYPMGGTNLGGALSYCASFNPKSILLVSDGMPDSEAEAIREAKRLGVPINVIYIGPENSRGAEFLKKLSNMTSGKSVTVAADIINFGGELAGKIRLMLGDEKTNKKGPIAL